MVIDIIDPPLATQRSLYDLHPKQKQVMEVLGLSPDWMNAVDPVEELMFGGQAGGGKSQVLRVIAATLAMLWPGSRVPLFRRTYPELEDTHIAKIRAEWPSELGKYNGERHEFVWANGSVTQFRYAKEEADVYSYNSSEWEALLVDEATHFSEAQLRYLRTRVRSTRPGWRKIVVYGTNPGSLSHAYFKSQFVDYAVEGSTWVAPKTDGGMRRCFLRSRLDDNPSLDADAYSAMIEGVGDDTLKRALLDGDWDIFSGQFFKEWRRTIHVCEPFAIPKDWVRWGAVDYGYADPCAVLWLARSPGRDRVVVYREFYQKGLRDEEQAAMIKKMSDEDHMRFWVLDPSMFNVRGEQARPSIAKTYRGAGLVCMKGSNARLAGWQVVRSNLAHDLEADPPKKPRLQVFSTCLNLIRTIPEQVHDVLHPEDLADRIGSSSRRTEDHACDSLRYALMAERQRVVAVTQQDARLGY